MNLIKSPLSYALNKAGVPTLAKGGQPKPLTWAANTGLHGDTSPYSTQPKLYTDNENVVEAYRHAPKNKNGNIETLPTGFNANMVTAYTKALRDAQTLGGRTLTPEELMTLALVEGRSDFGYNNLDVNDKKATALADKLISQGHNPDAAGFAAAIDNKMRTAERLNIPFSTAWNGTGRSKVGTTGADYTNRFNAAHGAGVYEHPKNALLYEAVQNGLMPDETMQNPEQATMPQVDVMGSPVGYKKGGSIAKQKAFLKFKKK